MIWDAMDAGGMSGAQWGALGVVVAALITAAGVWVTSRVTKANAATTAKVQADANAVAGLSALTDRLETRLDKIQAEADRSRETAERQQQEIDELRRDLEVERRGTASLREALDAAVDYIDELTTAISTANPKATIPQPPPILAKLRQNYRRSRHT